VEGCVSVFYLNQCMVWALGSGLFVRFYLASGLHIAESRKRMVHVASLLYMDRSSRNSEYEVDFVSLLAHSLRKLQRTAAT